MFRGKRHTDKARWTTILLSKKKKKTKKMDNNSQCNLKKKYNII
jgi:hypothetical protein